MEEIVKEIHYSYMTQDFIINLIKDKWPELSKLRLKKFFASSCLKIKCKMTFRKQWIVKKEIIDNLNIPQTSICQLIESHNKFYEEKEKERKKELELNEKNAMNNAIGINFGESAQRNFNFDNNNTDYVDFALMNLPEDQLKLTPKIKTKKKRTKEKAEKAEKAEKTEK